MGKNIHNRARARSLFRFNWLMVAMVLYVLTTLLYINNPWENQPVHAQGSTVTMPPIDMVLQPTPTDNDTNRMTQGFGEAVAPGYSGGLGNGSTINSGFSEPLSPIVQNYPAVLKGQRYHRSRFFKAVANPEIPACATNIRVAVTGGNYRYRFTGHNGVGIWSSDPDRNAPRDYPETAFILLHAGQNIVPGNILFNSLAFEVDYNLGLQQNNFPVETGYISVPNPRSNAATIRLFTYVETRDEYSNKGRQWKYQVLGKPMLRVRYDNSNCPVPPRCNSFTATPSIINSQGNSTLAWTSANADRARIFPGAGIGPNGDGTNLPANGSVTVSPVNTTTYTLRLRNDNGPTDTFCDVTVTVRKNQPFLRSTGADVYAGAVLASGQGCQLAREQYAHESIGAGQYGRAISAGIETLGRYEYGGSTSSIDTTLMGFSSTQYAALASGLIMSTGDRHYAGNNGFARAVTTPRQVKDLLFANDAGGQDGAYGDFYNGANDIPCLDYASVINEAQAHIHTGTLSQLFNTGTQPVMRRTSAWNIGATSIPAGGKARTIVVAGGVHITGNIEFPASYGVVDDIPYLQIIAQGPITIAPTVSRIDAHLVSLPSTNPAAGGAVAGHGIIDTCQGTNIPTWPSSMTVNSCRTKLSVNGSLTAQKIYWKRTYGTLLSSNLVLANEATNGCVFRTNPPASSASADAISAWIQTQSQLCSAELINLNPELYLGRPSDESDSTDSPPIGTIELPPIL